MFSLIKIPKINNLKNGEYKDIGNIKEE